MINKKDIEDVNEFSMECIITQFTEQINKLHSKLDTRTTTYDDILKHIGNSYHSHISALEENQTEVERIKFELSTHTGIIKSIQAENEKYNSKVSAVEAQLPKDNLCCHAIKIQGKSIVDSGKTFVIDSLNIPMATDANMEILCCFSIGIQIRLMTLIQFWPQF